MKNSSQTIRHLCAGRNPSGSCASCRFFAEGRGEKPALCRRHKIRTSTAASCGDYDRKYVPYSA